MAETTDITSFRCPSCMDLIEHEGDSDSQCPSCGWKGRARVFRPVTLQVDTAQDALPDDAVCAHHPGKRAVAICAGTGDYICTLCCLEIDGHTYSAQHLNTAGKDKMNKAFDRYLTRPDRTVVLYMGLCLVPYVNVLWILAMPVWIPLGYTKLVKANRMRHQDALFATIVSKSRLIVLSLLLSAFAALMLLAIVSVTSLIISRL